MAEATLEAYLDHLRHERRYSAHTLEGYARDITAFGTWLQANVGSSDWLTATPSLVRAWITRLHRDGNAPRSLRRKLSSVRSFYAYLLRRGTLSANPADDIPLPKLPQRLPKSLDIEAVTRLVELPAATPLELRDRAIMELFYSSGLRLAELTALDLGDLDLDGGLVRVLGKGQRERECPVGAKAIAALRAWLAVRESLATCASGTAMFLGAGGRRLTPRAIQKRIAEWGLKRGLDQRVHPHRLRHAFATHLLESSGDLRAVQELLGHASIAATQVYTHLDLQHLAKVYDAAHPRARRRKDTDPAPAPRSGLE